MNKLIKNTQKLIVVAVIAFMGVIPVYADASGTQVYGTSCIQKVNGSYGITSIDNCNYQTGIVDSELAIVATVVFATAITMVAVGKFIDPERYFESAIK